MTIFEECPICGDPLKVRHYQEEIWGYKQTVETHKSCACGYEHSDAYGVVNVTIPYDAEEDR